MQMAVDVQVGEHGGPLSYPDPVQGGEEKVTRQLGIPPGQQTMARDPQPPKAIVQGDHEVVAYRNPGNGAQQFASDGTLHSDHRSDDNTFFADHPLSDPANQPGLARTNAPLPDPPAFVAPDRAAIKAQAEAMGFVVSDAPAGAPPAGPPVVDVMQADQPGSGDPRDMSTGPQVISALPVIKKAPIVPVNLPEPKTRRIVAKAAAKKGGRK
jgi:hypothetical protein